MEPGLDVALWVIRASRPQQEGREEAWSEGGSLGATETLVAFPAADRALRLGTLRDSKWHHRGFQIWRQQVGERQRRSLPCQTATGNVVGKGRAAFTPGCWRSSFGTLGETPACQIPGGVWPERSPVGERPTSAGHIQPP